jgi:hypothetical protein
MHPHEGQLKTYLDGELSVKETYRLESHLQACTFCQDRLGQLRDQHKLVHNLFAAIDSPASVSFSPTKHTVGRLSARLVQTSKEQKPMWQIFSRRSLRPVWTVVFILVFLFASLLIPPVRAAAVNFLSLFRVQTIQVVQFNPANLPQNFDEQMVQLDDLLKSLLQFEGAGEPVEVSSLADASEMADFPVADVTGFNKPKAYSYQPGGHFQFTIDIEILQPVLAELGSDYRIPKILDGEQVSMNLQPSVTTRMGTCASAGRSDDPDKPVSVEDCTILVQMPSPEINVPPGVDPQEVGQAMLQLLGFTESEARQISQNVDWTSTLILPVPEQVAFEQVTVQGVPATLLTEASNQGGGEFAPYTLLWTREGILYGLTGSGNPQQALELANSIR